MRVIGLDLSLRATGWAVAEPRGIVAHGVIHPPKDVMGVARLAFLGAKLAELLDTYKPDTAVLEGYAYGVRGGKVFEIGEWGGVARMRLYDFGIMTLECSPMSLKQAVTGKGTADKKAMMAAVRAKWGFLTKDDNEADAFALAMVGLARMGAYYRRQPLDMNIPKVGIVYYGRNDRQRKVQPVA